MNNSKITWHDNTPYSVEFNDCYHPPKLGLEQAQYIFMQGNQLEQRFKNLAERKTFVIGETGFGIGLNFLVAMQLFEQNAPKNSKLYFISCERYPLKLDDIKRALGSYSKLNKQAQLLVQNYHAICANSLQCINLTNNVTLQLLLGDGAPMFNQLNTQIDALFLDGFNPRTNHDMWSSDLFNALAKLSHNQTTFSTFASAGYVKRNLQDAGFKVFKNKGFANKREHLFGAYIGKNISDANNQINTQNNTGTESLCVDLLKANTTNNIPTFIFEGRRLWAGSTSSGSVGALAIKNCDYNDIEYEFLSS